MKPGRSQLTAAIFPSRIAWRDITDFQVPDFKIRVSVINKRKFAVQTDRWTEGQAHTNVTFRFATPQSM
jgi:hypothetical protein